MASSRPTHRNNKAIVNDKDLVNLLNDLDVSDVEGLTDGDEEPTPRMFGQGIDFEDDTDEDPTFTPFHDPEFGRMNTSSESDSDEAPPKKKKKILKKTKTRKAEMPKPQNSASSKGSEATTSTLTDREKQDLEKSKKSNNKKPPMPPWENRTFQPETVQLSEPSYIPINTNSFTQFQFVEQKKKVKRYVTVKQPKSINTYNQKMGGVDLADRMLSYCSSRARTKKWTLRLILHIFVMAISNGWLQFREDKKNAEVPLHKIIQLRSYKLEYGQYLIEQNSQGAMFEDHNVSEEEETLNNQLEEHTPSRKKTPVVVPTKERRSQGALHLPIITGGIQNRCRADKCNKKTSVMCTKCEIYLCLTAQRNCFLKFHKP